MPQPVELQIRLALGVFCSSEYPAVTIRLDAKKSFVLGFKVLGLGALRFRAGTLNRLSSDVHRHAYFASV